MTRTTKPFLLLSALPALQVNAALIDLLYTRQWFDVVVGNTSEIFLTSDATQIVIPTKTSDATSTAWGVLSFDYLILQGIGSVTLQFTSSLFTYTHPVTISILTSVPDTPGAPSHEVRLVPT